MRRIRFGELGTVKRMLLWLALRRIALVAIAAGYVHLPHSSEARASDTVPAPQKETHPLLDSNTDIGISIYDWGAVVWIGGVCSEVESTDIDKILSHVKERLHND